MKEAKTSHLHEHRKRIPKVELSGAGILTFGSLHRVQAREVLREFGFLPLAPD